MLNGACFTSLVVLAGAAPGLLATEVIGRVNLGFLLCLAFGAQVLGTTLVYDHRMARECDPEAERLRNQAAESAAAAVPVRLRAGSQETRWW